MILLFRRTGQRRYGVEAQREGFPDVVMNPAPGYDPVMPHDMMHLVVEAQLGFTRGIFGQLAAGGDAGTFHIPMKAGESSREVARRRIRVKERGRKLLKAGRDESVRSEQAAHICRQEWLARSRSTNRKKLAPAMSQQAGDDATELRTLNQSKLDEICTHLDQLSSHWSRLEVGQSMAVQWPDLTIVESESVGY